MNNNLSAALCDVSYGLYIVSSCDGEKLNGQLTNTVFQVTAEPPKMAVAINKKNLTHEYIARSGVYSVSVVAQGASMIFIGMFGFRTGRDTDKFAKVKFKKGQTGVPIVLDNTLSAFEVKVTQTVDAGTHTLFIGEILGGEKLAEGKPLTYDYYHSVMRGKTPRNATTYTAPAPLSAGEGK